MTSGTGITRNPYLFSVALFLFKPKLLSPSCQWPGPSPASDRLQILKEINKATQQGLGTHIFSLISSESAMRGGKEGGKMVPRKEARVLRHKTAAMQSITRHFCVVHRLAPG